MNDRLSFFLPSPSSRFFPYVKEYLVSRDIELNLHGRKLFCRVGNLDCFMARGFDIPQLISKGWGDVGITGWDAIQEANLHVSLLDRLGIRFSEVVIASNKISSLDQLRPKDTVVSEYRRITTRYLTAKNLQTLNVCYASGSAEGLGVLPNVSAIVTLKTAGLTLRDNGFSVLDTILQSEACLIANPSSYLKKSRLLKKLRAQLVRNHDS